MPEHKLVIVEWLDIVGTGRWDDHSPEELEPAQCYSVGWLVHQDEHKVVITSTVATDHGTGGSTVFPVGCIKNIMEIQEHV